jgi:FAD synthase
MTLAAKPSKMTFIRGLQSFKSCDQRSVVTIGSFDGVHLGHQAIIAQVKAKSSATFIPSACTLVNAIYFSLCVWTVT